MGGGGGEGHQYADGIQPCLFLGSWFGPVREDLGLALQVTVGGGGGGLG